MALMRNDAAYLLTTSQQIDGDQTWYEESRRNVSPGTVGLHYDGLNIAGSVYTRDG